MIRPALGILCTILCSLLALGQEQHKYHELHDKWLASLTDEVKTRMDSYKALGIKSEQLRYSLAMEGISSQSLTALERAGVSLKDMSNLSRKDYRHRAIEFECIVVATIKNISYDTTSASCFHTIVEVQAERYIKASPTLRSAKTLTILLRSGPLSGTRRVKVTHEFRPELGITYVFFLSNHILRYSMAPATSCHFQLTDTSFFASEMSPRVVGKEVWFPYSLGKQQLSDFLKAIEKTVNILIR